MNNLPLHPAIVHLPLALAAIVPLLAAGLGLAIWKGVLPRKSWAVVVALQVLLVAGGVAALKTGEQDEESVEKRVAERTIERHETVAERFVWAGGVTLVIGAAGLIVRSNPAVAGVIVATTLAAIVTAGLGFDVGHSGGEIVYGPGSLTGLSAGAPAAQGKAGERRD